MVWYFVSVGLLVIVACGVYVTFFSDRADPHIPYMLTQKELWLNGNKLMYQYNGQWYEAVARTANSVIIYDAHSDKLVRVPLVSR